MVKKLLAGVSGGLLLTLSVPMVAFAATTTVTPSNMQGWQFVQETPIGSGMMVTGPEKPPLGSGSANLVVDNTGGEALAKAAYQGLNLSDIDNLEYSTYRTTGAPALAVALQFNIDRDGEGGINTYQGRLVYEPYFTHEVITGEWQTWNPMDNAGTGNWWFSNAATATLGGCSQSNPCTWQEVLDKNPDIEIHQVFGAVVLKAGSGWIGGFSGNVDALTINTDTYDFELTNQPKSKDDCKKDGYKDMTDASGKPFKNQGQCVSYANHN